MHIHKKSHRWLVATPLFVLILVLSIREGLMQRHIPADISSGHSIVIGTDQTVKTVAAGESVFRMDPGSQMDISDVKNPVLFDGTVLAVSRTLFHMRVDGLDLEGWDGGFQVTKQGSDVTIVALTTPVLVTDEGHQTIVPPLMQWKRQLLSSVQDGVNAWYRSRVSLVLPQAFSEEQLQTMQSLQSSLIVAGPLMETSFLPPTLGQELRLAPARDRAESANRTMRLDGIAQALSHDPSTVDALLDTGDILDLFASSEGQEAMPALLSLAEEDGKGDFFLPSFVSAPDRLILAMFHPLIRDHARALPVTAVLSDDETLLSLLLTPFSDVAPEALADVSVSQWQTAWQDFLRTQSGSVSVFSDALPLLKEQIDRLDYLQFAKRMDTYASALLVVGDTVQDGLSPDAESVLHDIHILRDARRSAAQISDVPVVSVSSSSASTQSQRSSVVSEAALQRARDVLLQKGFMATPQTAFVPAANGVQVKDIVFGTAKGDITLRFTFDPVASQVNAIEQNGKILPYAIPLQQFMDWLKVS